MTSAECCSEKYKTSGGQKRTLPLSNKPREVEKSGREVSSQKEVPKVEVSTRNGYRTSAELYSINEMNHIIWWDIFDKSIFKALTEEAAPKQKHLGATVADGCRQRASSEQNPCKLDLQNIAELVSYRSAGRAAKRLVEIFIFSADWKISKHALREWTKGLAGELARGR